MDFSPNARRERADFVVAGEQKAEETQAMESKAPDSSAKQWIVTAVSFGLPMGILYSLQNNNWVIGMAGGLVAGVLFAVCMRWFMARQAKRFSIDPPDFHGAAILHKGPANHFKGA
ncbi:MAG: hypothetical protein ACKO2G_12525, partial [Verrucomicrobiales bacterium]